MQRKRFYIYKPWSVRSEKISTTLKTFLHDEIDYVMYTFGIIWWNSITCKNAFNIELKFVGFRIPLFGGKIQFGIFETFKDILNKSNFFAWHCRHFCKMLLVETRSPNVSSFLVTSAVHLNCERCKEREVLASII